MNEVQRTAIALAAITVVAGPLLAVAQGETIRIGLAAGVFGYLGSGLLMLTISWAIEGDLSALDRLRGMER